MSNPLNVYYNSKVDRLEAYSDDSSTSYETFELYNYPLVKTADVKRVLDHIRPWLENQESFALIGPEGCGKSYGITL
jgi:DNA replication protein DnaC